jgi:hypothetical protein
MSGASIGHFDEATEIPKQVSTETMSYVDGLARMTDGWRDEQRVDRCEFEMHLK